jgi:hypothetical protein
MCLACVRGLCVRWYVFCLRVRWYLMCLACLLPRLTSSYDDAEQMVLFSAACMCVGMYRTRVQMVSIDQHLEGCMLHIIIMLSRARVCMCSCEHMHMHTSVAKSYLNVETDVKHICREYVCMHVCVCMKMELKVF